MGRITQKFIKRTGIALMEREPELFKADFDENKKLLQNKIETGILISPSKRMRNRLSGFLTTAVKKQSRPRQVKETYKVSEN